MKKKATPAKAAVPPPPATAPAAAPPAVKVVSKKTPIRKAKKKQDEKKESKPPSPPPKPQKWMKGDPTSGIVITARKKVDVNPRNPAKAAALAVIHQLAKRAQALAPADKAIVVKFLTAAYEDVKKVAVPTAAPLPIPFLRRNSRSGFEKGAPPGALSFSYSDSSLTSCHANRYHVTLFAVSVRDGPRSFFTTSSRLITGFFARNAAAPAVTNGVAIDVSSRPPASVCPNSLVFIGSAP